ncbi:hypothetical protein PABG_07296 [Paracoccidioides brasiliensis Pb03]|nr:hypothetical protein PABG_07296 [Paracoccidioides brasiliensis Pb03]
MAPRGSHFSKSTSTPHALIGLPARPKPQARQTLEPTRARARTHIPSRRRATRSREPGTGRVSAVNWTPLAPHHTVDRRPWIGRGLDRGLDCGLDRGLDRGLGSPDAAYEGVCISGHPKGRRLAGWVRYAFGRATVRRGAGGSALSRSLTRGLHEMAEVQISGENSHAFSNCWWLFIPGLHRTKLCKKRTGQLQMPKSAPQRLRAQPPTTRNNHRPALHVAQLKIRSQILRSRGPKIQFAQSVCLVSLLAEPVSAPFSNLRQVELRVQVSTVVITLVDSPRSSLLPPTLEPTPVCQSPNVDAASQSAPRLSAARSQNRLNRWRCGLNIANAMQVGFGKSRDSYWAMKLLEINMANSFMKNRRRGQNEERKRRREEEREKSTVDASTQPTSYLLLPPTLKPPPKVKYSKSCPNGMDGSPVDANDGYHPRWLVFLGCFSGSLHLA